MEKLKQSLIDIGIVFGIPLLFLWSYAFFQSDGEALLSLVSTSLTGQVADDELGMKTKEALAELRLIKLDTSLFSSPEFLTLRDYPVTIDPIPLGRPNPFGFPPALIDQLRHRR